MKVSFVIPLHNEEKNCPKVMDRIIIYARKKKLNFEVVPVDDRSTDNTKKILQSFENKYSFVHPVYRKSDSQEKGNTMGQALIAGTRSSFGKIVIWTMGDLADDVETYGKIIGKINQGYDLVLGSRYMEGGSRGNLDLLKAFLSSWGTRLARLLFGIPVHDITNAFRGFRKELFDKIKLESAGFNISPEFAIKAHLKGFKLGEVPTTYTNRTEGVSNFKLYHMINNYLYLYLLLFYRYKILKRNL